MCVAQLSSIRSVNKQLSKRYYAIQNVLANFLKYYSHLKLFNVARILVLIYLVEYAPSHSSLKIRVVRCTNE